MCFFLMVGFFCPGMGWLSLLLNIPPLFKNKTKRPLSPGEVHRTSKAIPSMACGEGQGLPKTLQLGPPGGDMSGDMSDGLRGTCCHFSPSRLSWSPSLLLHMWQHCNSPTASLCNLKKQDLSARVSIL